MNDAPRSLHGLRLAEIEEVLRADGLNPHHAKALWRAIQRGYMSHRCEWRSGTPAR